MPPVKLRFSDFHKINPPLHEVERGQGVRYWWGMAGTAACRLIAV